MSALILFAICTFANVVLGTIKSVMTIRGSKLSAAFWNALSFGLYSYIVILTATADLTTIEKIITTIGCNLIGVYLVKYVEEKMRKDKIWKFELTIPEEFTEEFHYVCSLYSLSHNYIENIGKYTIFNIYAKSQEESKKVKEIAAKYDAKLFATETKLI